VFLQRHEVIEGSDLRQLAGMDEAHKDVVDMCTVEGLIEERVLPVKDCPLQCLLAQGMPTA